MARWRSTLIRRLTAPVSPCVNRDYRICSRCGDISEGVQGVDEELTCTRPPKGYLPIYIAVLHDARQCNYGIDGQQSHQQKEQIHPQHEQKTISVVHVPIHMGNGVIRETGERDDHDYPETRRIGVDTTAQHHKRFGAGVNGKRTKGNVLMQNGKAHGSIQCTKGNAGDALSTENVAVSRCSHGTMLCNDVSCKMIECTYGNKENNCTPGSQKSFKCNSSNKTTALIGSRNSRAGDESGGTGDWESENGNATSTQRCHGIDSRDGVGENGTDTSTSSVCHGVRWKRYLVKAVHLNHPLMTELLKHSAREFGYSRHGALRVLCDPLTLHLLLRLRLLHVPFRP